MESKWNENKSTRNKWEPLQVQHTKGMIFQLQLVHKLQLSVPIWFLNSNLLKLGTLIHDPKRSYQLEFPPHLLNFGLYFFCYHRFRLTLHNQNRHRKIKMKTDSKQTNEEMGKNDIENKLELQLRDTYDWCSLWELSFLDCLLFSAKNIAQVQPVYRKVKDGKANKRRTCNKNKGNIRIWQTKTTGTEKGRKHKKLSIGT